ncbi:hypothetical protein LX36DRAFT_589172 [Colletotrichum falcatum]|nr:hypothetical protein LX36DRAFT_589172 [Colletotrichum falcatum]
MGDYMDLDRDLSWESDSPNEEFNGNASDFGWFIKDCVLAKNKWLHDQSFIWNGTLRRSASHPEAGVNGDTDAVEAQHGHMELEYPGPMPDGRGVSVTDYTRDYLNGTQYGVVNAAFNALDQELAFTVYFIIGPRDPEEDASSSAATRVFDVEGVRLYLQRTGFFDAQRREQELGPMRRRHPRFFENMRPVFLVDDPKAAGNDRVLTVKFVLGAAHRGVTVADLRMWFCVTRFFDRRARNREIAAEVERVAAQHAQRGDDADASVREYLAGLDPGNAFR